MSSTASSGAAGVRPDQRLEVLFDELAELAGQRNAIDGRIVEIVAELDRDELCGATGARSVAALVAWKTGSSPGNANTITTVARRLEAFPRCAQGMREGRLSLDQVGVIAHRAAEGSDEHYAALAGCATVSQLRTAVKLEPRPEPDTRPEPQRSITKSADDEFTCWRIKLPHLDAAKFDAALQSHLDALIAEWKQDHDNRDRATDHRPPLPTTAEAFMRLVEAGWDAEAARRPHGHHTTVVMHLDVKARAASLHLGPLLSEPERRYLMCDATYEVWFERDGEVIGSGRATRQINRRLRRALEHRHPTVRGSRLRSHPRTTRTPHPALGRRWPHRAGQPRAGMPLSPPAAPSRHHHHHRTRTQPHRHRQRQPTTQRRIASPHTEPTPARRSTLPRTHRRARRLVVVPTIPAATTTDKQLGRSPQAGHDQHVYRSLNGLGHQEIRSYHPLLPHPEKQGRQPNPHRHRPATRRPPQRPSSSSALTVRTNLSQVGSCDGTGVVAHAGSSTAL